MLSIASIVIWEVIFIWILSMIYRKCRYYWNIHQYYCVIPFQVEILGDQQPSTCLFLARDPSTDATSLLQVEGYAIHYYTTVLGWPKALHAEGSTLSTLFVLLMWDIIFSSHIPDIFRGPYQVCIFIMFCISCI